MDNLSGAESLANFAVDLVNSLEIGKEYRIKILRDDSGSLSSKIVPLPNPEDFKLDSFDPLND